MDTAERLAGVIADQAARRPRLAVAVDGPDAAGKTTLADQIAGVPCPTSDPRRSRWFHQPRQARYRRRDLSAEGYYRDRFDYPATTGQCLTLFREGQPAIRTAVHDFRVGAAHDARAELPACAVLIFDGIFSCGRNWPPARTWPSSCA